VAYRHFVFVSMSAEQWQQLAGLALLCCVVALPLYHTYREHQRAVLQEKSEIIKELDKASRETTGKLWFGEGKTSK
jgi:hypothetical protein